MEISEPVNPIAVHIGGGVIQLHTDSPEEGELSGYEIECAFSLSGKYQRFSNRFFTANDAYIYNFIVSRSAFIRIRANGTDGSVSEWVQVKRGKIEKSTVSMQCSAIAGSIIPQGAMFTVPKKPDRIIGFSPDEDIIFYDLPSLVISGEATSDYLEAPYINSIEAIGY